MCDEQYIRGLGCVCAKCHIFVLCILLQYCMLIAVVVWSPADCLLYTTAIQILCLSASLQLILFSGRDFQGKVLIHLLPWTLFVTLHWQCTSVDYTNLDLSLYTCAIHTIQCG